MTSLVTSILVFVGIGILFLFVNLFLGRLIRPNRPSPEKGDIYECGEKPVGSAWIQFDLRFYVIALLFVIFDVEIAFFFPWAVVFGSETRNLEAGTANAEISLAFGKIIFLEFLVFFGILLVGFAYLWRRGDLEWVRTTSNTPPKSGN